MAAIDRPLSGRGKEEHTSNEQQLAILQPDRGFDTHRVELPPEWTANLGDTFAILQLDTQTWRPSNWIPDATDIRDLGVRIDWIEVR
ncbi:MAG TPA: hypothetical protein VJB88_07115 [Vicinamibacteria bacterium]|nr:hypothetical protein [Vicinamibacteria bacterium]